MPKEKKSERTRPKFRIGILIIVSLLVLGATFTAYMLNTNLEETLINERGESIITHEYYESESE